MSVARRFVMCPSCGTEDIEEFARVEADEFMPEDVALYRCHGCGHEWDTGEVGRRLMCCPATRAHEPHDWEPSTDDGVMRCPGITRA